MNIVVRKACFAVFAFILLIAFASCEDKSGRNIITVDELPSGMLGGTARIYTDHKTSGGADYIAVVTEAYDGKMLEFTDEYVSKLKVGDVIQCDPDHSIVVTKYERDDEMILDQEGESGRAPGTVFVTDEWFFRHNNENEGDPDKWQLANINSPYEFEYGYSGDAFWIPLSDNCRITRIDNYMTAENPGEMQSTVIDREELFEILDGLEETTGRHYIRGEYSTMNNKVIGIGLNMDDMR
ncbi:hypothetical protein SAMN02910456_02717 [Ruminococcaceae bacterium YRB3002]|nr:hypothetical protein SAMN02910456_02717 [Ruminococcaceae bacterium YRB3002]